MKILIVDDIRENLHLLETLLKGMGYEVISATNGAEALEKLREEMADMIISDILMPVMDGFCFCKEVKGDNALKHIPFIFYTASYTDEKDEELARKIGASRFIRKPLQINDFTKVIEDVMKDEREGKLESRESTHEEEVETFKLYSERLVRKLEEKMFQLEKEIIERKQAEEALQKAHDELHKFSRELEKRVKERTEELREKDKQLVEAEKLAALGKMANRVAHELRNPLTVVGGFARRIFEKTSDDDRHKEYLGIIIREVTDMEKRVSEIIRIDSQ